MKKYLTHGLLIITLILLVIDDYNQRKFASQLKKENTALKVKQQAYTDSLKILKREKFAFKNELEELQEKFLTLESSLK